MIENYISICRNLNVKKIIFIIIINTYNNDTSWNFWKKQSVLQIFFYSFVFQKTRNQNKKKPQKNNRNQYSQHLIIISLFNFDVLLIQGQLEPCGSIPTNETI